MNAHMRLFGVLGLCGACLLPGCFIPYASVPARMEIGGVGARGAIPTPAEGGGVAESDQADMLHLRVGLNPAQGYNGWHDRRFDLGGGYLAEWLWPEGQNRRVIQGFHLEGAYFLLPARAGVSSWRIAVLCNLEYLLTDFTERARTGPGLTAGLLLEWAGTTQKTYAESSGGGLGSSAGAFGALYGEWGVGIAVTGSYRRLYDMDFFTLFAGLSFRLPFGAGAMGISN